MTMTARERFLACMDYKPVDRTPFSSWGGWPETVERWTKEGYDPAIQRCYPLYRYAAELVDGTRPVLADGGQDWFGRLDVTFRNALLDDLDGAGWAADLTQGGGDAALPRGKAPPIRLILSGIESRLGRVRGLNVIAREMGLRPNQLRRLFRREMGGEASVYLRKRRMDIARGLLADRSLSVKEIAGQVGYASAATFCRAYRAFWGHYPSADRYFRKMTWHFRVLLMTESGKRVGEGYPSKSVG